MNLSESQLTLLIDSGRTAAQIIAADALVYKLAQLDTQIREIDAECDRKTCQIAIQINEIHLKARAEAKPLQIKSAEEKELAADEAIQLKNSVLVERNSVISGCECVDSAGICVICGTEF